MITCPKCGHIRTPQEDEFTPDWQCPACGIAYAKVSKEIPTNPTQALEIPVEEKPKRISINRFIRPAIIVVVTGLAVLGGVYGYSEYERLQAIKLQEAVRVQNLADAERIMELADRWSGAWRLAASTGRIALAIPVKDLQALTREARDIKVSGCAEKMRESLFKSMDHGTKGFLLFMSGKDNENESTEMIVMSKDQISKYADEKDACLAEVGNRKPGAAK